MLPDGLLDDVKNYLDITWAVDAGTDAKVTGIISRGMARLQDIAGVSLDFTAEDLPRSLLFDYCFYARSNALDDFETNYLSTLLSLQRREEVKAYTSLTSLSSLTVGTIDLYPTFDPLTTFYTATTPNAGDIIAAIPTDQSAIIAIVVNGTTSLVNGTIAIWITDNAATITVTNGDAITIYTLKITKTA